MRMMMAKQRGPPSATTTTSTVERFLTVETTRYWNPDDTTTIRNSKK